MNRWYFAFAFLAATLLMVWRWFDREEINDWMGQTWGFAKSIIPLVVRRRVRDGLRRGLIPEKLVASWVGGNSFAANFVASVIGAMWYFATLTEIPILEALIGLGMGRGPALALLLAGPALVAAEHRGDLQRDRLQKDRRLCFPDGDHERHCGHGVRLVLCVTASE